VALVWPYKDCILEGGQSREDKREEIFFNEVLAQDRNQPIIRSKVTNTKFFYTDGEKSI
jgi:adenine-specific DNA-methyltransferase